LPRVRLKNAAEEQLRELPRFWQERADKALLRLYADAQVGTQLRGNLRGKWKLTEGRLRIFYRIRENGSLVIVEAILLRDRRTYPSLGH